MLTIKDSDAADVSIATIGFSGMNQIGRDMANTSTYIRSFETKHTHAVGNNPGRHLLAGKARKYDAATGKWGECGVNLTMYKDSTGIISLDVVEDLVAIIMNYFTKNAAAMPAGFSTEIQKFLDGISPF